MKLPMGKWREVVFETTNSYLLKNSLKLACKMIFEAKFRVWFTSNLSRVKVDSRSPK